MIALLIALALGAAAAPQDPLVSVWYRGRPAGVPRAEDLAEIRAAGFPAITWPVTSRVGVNELTRLADAAPLTVVVRPETSALSALTALTAFQAGQRVDLSITTTPT